jgi:pimeloyl-ACP methyl ester carboxylesterase
MNGLNQFWHKNLGRPFTLTKVVDQGMGPTVILLHGLGVDTHIWKNVIALAGQENIRIVGYDLLGFGKSPKPDWIEYDIDDHVKPLIRSLEKLDAKKPFIIVGHSMGCLIALRLARVRPDLVKHLVLYEMPLYDGLPNKRIYRLRLSLYSKFYNWVINFKPSFDPMNLKAAQRIAKRIGGFEVNAATWNAFIRSLQNTIMDQTAADDLAVVRTKMDVIYGTMDMLVIRGNVEQVIGTQADSVESFSIRARHVISERAAKLILQRVSVALGRTVT